jgi:ABC-type transporter Mla MlaB component
MATKDENAGLLSKVVKFVKNPTTNWADLDQQESDKESSYSKQMLKEMIERKRRNDFVRKREFDMLRKMRRSEVMAGADPAARPSFFQSSMPSKPDDRATTLKKIDEIEAQMSMQWWKTKHGDSSRAGSSTNFPMSSQVPPESGRSTGAVPMRSTAYTKTAPQPLAPGAEKTAAGDLRPIIDSAKAGGDSQPSLFAPSKPADPKPGTGAAGPATPARPAAGAPSLGAASSANPSSQPGSAATSAFSASKLFAIDVDEFAHDPELEEAAIRFANGDDAGAEAGLMEVLGAMGARVDHDETWMTMFDLFRATGQQDRFEAVAIDFASRFGRSAPQWFSIPEAVKRMKAVQTSGPDASAQVLAHWTCPPVIGTQTVAAMNAALAKAPAPWRLSWAKLNSIDEAALEGLTRLFTQWTVQPVQLRFIVPENLEKVLRNYTPSSDKGVNPAWWKLRMELLRVMHRPDEFELVALDYCVTYEVSPPSWESARCEYKPLESDGSYVAGHTIIGEAFHDSLSSGLGYGDTAAVNSQMSNISTVELAGQVLGDASEALNTLETKLLGADIMVISCARLIRIDFSAAGTLLNWVTARQAEGRQVQFIEVHRLVAAFFNVIGISEHARVMARAD